MNVDRGWWLHARRFDHDFDKYLQVLSPQHRKRTVEMVERFDSECNVSLHYGTLAFVPETQVLIRKRFPLSEFRNENKLIIKLQEDLFQIEIRGPSYKALGYGFFEKDRFYYWNAGRDEVSELGNYMLIRIMKEMFRRKVNWINGGITDHYRRWHYGKAQILGGEPHELLPERL